VAGRCAPRRAGGATCARFNWDTGQGWGIDLDFGGMKCCQPCAKRIRLFIHCGDTIYADGPMLDEVNTAAYGIWRNAFLNVPRAMETLQVPPQLSIHAV
jgi:alkaline phosphatase D